MNRWYEALNQWYEEKAAELVSDGWKRQPSKHYADVFTKDNKTVALVRKLADTEWYTTEVN